VAGIEIIIVFEIASGDLGTDGDSLFLELEEPQFQRLLSLLQARLFLAPRGFDLLQPRLAFRQFGLRLLHADE
jgi:hypothetical protein